MKTKPAQRSPGTLGACLTGAVVMLASGDVVQVSSYLAGGVFVRPYDLSAGRTNGEPRVLPGHLAVQHIHDGSKP